MKKSLMTAVGAAVLLTGMTAFANEYPITHPFYMPDKDGCFFDVGYNYIQSKFKTDDAKFIYDNKKAKTNTYTVDGIYAVSDKCYVNVGYSGIKNKIKAKELEVEAYGELWNWDPSFDAKDRTWYIGVTDKFIDDSMLVTGTVAYYQKNGDSYSKTDRGAAVELFCGGRTNSDDPWAVDPYIKIRCVDGNESNFIGRATLGFYKQVNDKFGINVGVNYSQGTDDTKEKYMEGLVDLRYAITKNCALKIGYGFQIFDKQRKGDYSGMSAIGRQYGDYSDDWDYSLKTKSTNHLFANLMFAF